jgi:hypothetical protein
LVTGEGKVVGHLAATPQYYRINGQRVVAHTPADYMVLPRYGFHALALMRRFFHTSQHSVACNLSSVATKIEARLGAEEVGRLRYATKLLDVSRLPQLPRWMPAALSGLFDRGLQAVDKALISGPEDRLEAEVLEGFDESFDELFRGVATVVPVLPEKGSAFLRWRYGRGSPQDPVTVLAVRGREGLLGYAVLKANTEGLIGYILDLTTLPRHHEAARALLREAIRSFKQADVQIIRYPFLESPTSPQSEDLWRLGFFFREKPHYTLLARFTDRDLHKTVRSPTAWSYSLGDGEASFWFR